MRKTPKPNRTHRDQRGIDSAREEDTNRHIAPERDTDRFIEQVFETLNRLLGTNLEPRYLPPRPGDVPHSMADISLARELLGYEPCVDFGTGLERTIEWIAAHGHVETHTLA